MSIFMQTLLFMLAVMFGGVLVLIIKQKTNLKFLLSFSGGFLLTIIFTHILPEAYKEIETTGFFILLGFFLQLVLEYFSKGAEHGHTHTNGSAIKVHFPLAVFISLSIHAFVEAIPINHASHHAHGLYWGVFVHKIPVAVALKIILDASGVSKRMSWTYLALFGIMAPLGLFFGDWLVHNFEISFGWLLATAIGMFFHVATTIIFESSEGHKINLYKLLAILAGFGIGIWIG
ncbi:ZIP family metal transporter [Crocinitomix algicola]|uniref:ZIP family metal transporter n=1 Tax=Crocinitomix algicola TaxID=1740263 RepID=UPI0009F62528|nr:ZIP family metal transporter [Crocinitomix algicola]